MMLRSATQDFHAGYTGKLHQLDLTAALDAQSGQQRGTVDSKGDVIAYHYFSLLPNLQAVWNFDKNRKLNMNYSSQPNLPGLQQLVPFTNVSNPAYPVTGNPDLKPSYTNNIGLHYEQSNLKPTQFFGFGMGLNYTSVRHTIIQDLTTPKDSSQVIQATTFLNAGTTDNLAAAYHITLPAFLDKRLRVNINGSVSRSQAITMTDSVKYVNQALNWNQSVHLQLLIPDVI
jgi:outer membrane receptor protein involved in Fe transport